MIEPYTPLDGITSMNRRAALKLGLAAGGALLVSSNRTFAAPVRLPTGGVFDPPSPPTRPFLQELPRMPIKCSLPGGANDLLRPENGGVLPNGTVYPQVSGPDALTTYVGTTERIVVPHQRNSGSNIQFPPQRHYVLTVRQATHVFHPDPPYNCGSIIWGYDGIFPGPTFISRYGVPILVRIINDLYFNPEVNVFIPGNFGNAQISTHLHNGHTGSESDGNPEDIYPPTPIDPGIGVPQYPDSILNLKFRDHHYSMFRAGLDPGRPASVPAPNVNDGDVRETVSTLWYHDHSMDHTAENVYKGLVGYHLLFDEFDSGDENDPAPSALRLPSHEFDIPLLFQDKRFDANGQLFLDPVPGHTGFLGDKFTVNGAIQPKLTVLRRKYRFRLLNAGPSRFYKFFLVKDGVDQPFQIIGNDESLLEHPLSDTDGSGTSSVLVSVAERAEVVFDFSQFNQGDQLFLVNRLVMQNNGQGPEAVIDATGKFTFEVLPPGAGDQILRFDVAGDAPDASRVPTTLRLKPDLPGYLPSPLTSEALKSLPNHREFVFGKTSGLWTINKLPFENFRVDFLPKQGGSPGAPDGEVWTIKNDDENWSHPIHIHLEEFRILLRNGVAPLPFEQVKKDVLLIGPLEEVQIFLRFRDFHGKYPIHCHNVTHEDHAMMSRFDVEP
jgi:FtsP/CotA-like multicopper oxidase with cupredoxin domain